MAASRSSRELTRFAELHERFYAITVKRRFPNPLLGSLIDALSDNVEQDAAKKAAPVD
jgi:hypothetical protein